MNADIIPVRFENGGFYSNSKGKSEKPKQDQYNTKPALNKTMRKTRKLI